MCHRIGVIIGSVYGLPPGGEQVAEPVLTSYQLNIKI